MFLSVVGDSLTMWKETLAQEEEACAGKIGALGV